MSVNATFFPSAAEFRAWLERHHLTAAELHIGFWKVKSGRAGLPYTVAVEEALCFGWIDGQLTRIDDTCHSIRFTPRRRGSVWSAVNIRRVEALRASGRMTAAGEAAFARRDPAKSAVYSFEQQRPPELSPAFVRRFKSHRTAWQNFGAQPPWYRRTVAHWVMTAKKEETRERRLAALIGSCEKGERLKQFSR